MSKTLDNAVLHISRLKAAADMTRVPRERLAYLVTPVEYNILRMEIVGSGGTTAYTATGIRIMGVPVLHE